MKDLIKLEKDFKGAVVDSIGRSKETGDFHFIFKKDGKYFGIGLKNFDTFEYLEAK